MTAEADFDRRPACVTALARCGGASSSRHQWSQSWPVDQSRVADTVADATSQVTPGKRGGSLREQVFYWGRWSVVPVTGAVEVVTVGYNNPPIPWSELERMLSDRSRPDGHGGRPVEADMLIGLSG
jgi:hypothetical protein